MSTSNKISGNYTFKDLILKTYISKKRAQAAAQGMTINFTSILDDVIDAGMEAIRKGQAVKKFRFDELREIMSTLGVVVLDAAPEATAQGGLFDETGELRKKLAEAETEISELQDRIVVLNEALTHSPEEATKNTEMGRVEPVIIASKADLDAAINRYKDLKINPSDFLLVRLHGLKKSFLDNNAVKRHGLACSAIGDGVYKIFEDN